MTAVVHRPLAPPVVYVGVLNHEQRMLLRVLDGSLRDWMISLCEWMVSMCGWMDGSLRECMVSSRECMVSSREWMGAL